MNNPIKVCCHFYNIEFDLLFHVDSVQIFGRLCGK